MLNLEARCASDGCMVFKPFVPGVHLENVVWTYAFSEKKFGMEEKISKYLMDSYWLDVAECISLKKS